MKSITLASIVFTLSFCLNLVEGRTRKSLPYKGSPSAGAETYPYPVEVEDAENNNGERGTYLSRTKRHIDIGGNVKGGSFINGPGASAKVGGNMIDTVTRGYIDLRGEYIRSG